MQPTQLNSTERVEQMFDFNDSQCSEVFLTEWRVDGKHFISPEWKGLGNQTTTTEKQALQ